jgi:nuclear pore complex protein Nup107
MALPATPYTTFARVFTSYHDQYGTNEAGPSRSSQIDSAIRYDIVLDEEGGLVKSLMSAVEEM